MKPFNLKEYLENPSRKVVTRDGKAVKIHCTNCIGSYPVIAEIEGEKYSYYYDKNGENFCNPSISGLFFAPEKHEGWVNVYKEFESNSNYMGRICNSEEEAKKKTDINGIYLATIKIEWEE